MTLTSASDADIVARLKGGDRAAFDEVYTRFRARIYAFLLRLSGRRDVADDLFQETWATLATHATRLRPDSDVAAWLFTVARNAYRSHRRWTMLDLARLAAGHDALASLATDGRAPDARAEDAQALLQVERALARLSPASREALILVAIEGFDQEQAAAIVGASYAAFRQRLARARAELSAATGREAGG